MPEKLYKTPKNKPAIVQEPVATYCRDTAQRTVSVISTSNSWNPNVPFYGTQEEWFEHFHRIEEGEFMTIDEFDHRVETWKNKYLASKLK